MKWLLIRKPHWYAIAKTPDYLPLRSIEGFIYGKCETDDYYVFLHITVMKRKIIGQNDDFIYRQISERITVRIQQFTLKTGDKLPSLRAFSKEQGVSFSTAYKAYVELEINGLIEARPKSGYYVRYTPVRKLGSAKLNTRLSVKSEVDTNELIVMVQQNFARADMIKLSLSIPDISLLPQAKLNKSMVEAMKTSSSSCMLYEDIQGFLDLRKHIARQAINWGR